MKKLLLLSLIICSSLAASAQKIHFTDTTNVWEQYITYYNDGRGDPHYHTYSYQRDSVINGNQYRLFNFKMYYLPHIDLGSWIREDTILKKVYLRDITNDSDVILMDYTLNVGDTFITTYDAFINCYYKYIVQSIDSTLINGVWHKIWHFSHRIACGNGGRLPDIIEGIGCIQNPLFMLETGGIEPPWTRMYCFSNNNVTPPVLPKVSHFDNTTSCIYFPHLAAGSLTRNSSGIEIYPNPAFTAINIAAQTKIVSIEISNTLGQLIYSNAPNTPQASIDITTFPSGIYLIRINGTEVRKFIKQ